MASNGSAAVALHIKRRGVFGTQQLSGLQDNAILQVALAGSNAKAPYLPWRVSPDSDPGLDPTWMRKEVADYILARARTQTALRNNANKSGMTTSNSGTAIRKIDFLTNIRHSARFNTRMRACEARMADQPHTGGAVHNAERLTGAA
jgi:hypothetical protein